jgi:hypothetical protein
LVPQRIRSNHVYSTLELIVQLEVYRDTAFKIVDQGIVDDEQWYTVRVYWKDCASWLRKQNETQRIQLQCNTISGEMFDVHGKLLTLMTLRWS